MITASAFAHKHTSFWKAHFPALESYVRVVNAGAYERVFPKFEDFVVPERSYIVSETSFCLAGIVNEPDDLDVAFDLAKKRLFGLAGIPEDIEELAPGERQTVREWSRRLRVMVQGQREDAAVEYSPEFAGCGALSRSTGDILINKTLVEVKSVERGFRATDFRQLITYMFQAIEDGSKPIRRISIMNPRRGVVFEEDASRFIFDVSASDILELQGCFRAALCMAGVSR